MSRKIKTLIISLGVLVLLGGGYYGSTIYKKKKDAVPPYSNTPSIRLGNLESSKLVKIEVPGIVLEKKGNVWELVSLKGSPPPAGIELDQSQISNMTYSMASIFIDRIVDEEPADLSVYGLDKPSTQSAVTDSDGKTVHYILGDMTPARTSYYIMEGGDPKVYIVSSYYGDNLHFSLDRIRIRSLFPDFDATMLTGLRLGSSTLIDISLKPKSARPYLASSFSTLVMTSPYKLPRGVDGEALDKLIAPLKNLEIADFIDDNPSSLSSYGLDKPFRISLRTVDASLDLLVGNQIDGKFYAKLPNAPGVFTLNGLDPIVNVKTFPLIDKFALLMHIDKVDHLSITGGERPLSADFQGKGDDAIFFLDGKQVQDKSFRTWYQAVIGLLSDAEYPGPTQNPEGDGNRIIAIDFQLNTPPGEQASITLIPYNRDFYALLQEGTMEFLISRNQVRRIWETADSMVFEP